MATFWDTLPRPCFVLAPLANVTDAAFRAIIAKYSKPQGPHVMWTEFVSADGLVRGNKELLMRDLAYGEAERPIVAQFFTGNPDMMERAAALARELQFDGVDINMGCPDRAVERGGAGAALIKNPERARELIRAAKRGAGHLPVSVKTRLGYTKDTLDAWLPELLMEHPAAVTIHARTRKEMSAVPARWERVARAVEIRNAMRSSARILGNGDAKDMRDARAKVAASGADGAMLGRAIFGTPWLFSQTREATEGTESVGGAQERNATFSHSQECENVARRLRIAVEHTRLFEKMLGDIKSFAVMKKHFKAYVEGFPGARELRMKLMECHDATEVERCIEAYLTSVKSSERN